MKILEALTNTGLCVSRGEAKKLVKAGGCFVNDEKIHDFDFEIDLSKPVLIRAGKTKEADLK